ncbi:hypothetical protein EXU30_07230 [Shewanella maritima]|uniref:Uncharacterized protein n=1 Tax=Shewanella maritima TaxID=2520507 RepID=A0A411PG30_9GAMM|nr:hypothetical protein [Shewanella maritima]QBF82511.1 hypothetical protein EXU30_07230 [Shewanella maritima]
MINEEKHRDWKLVLKYFLVYPLYYVTAMLVAVFILAWLKDWSFIFARKIFFIFSGIMWFVSYVAHFDIFKLSWGKK